MRYFLTFPRTPLPMTVILSARSGAKICGELDGNISIRLKSYSGSSFWGAVRTCSATPSAWSICRYSHSQPKYLTEPLRGLTSGAKRRWGNRFDKTCPILRVLAVCRSPGTSPPCRSQSTVICLVISPFLTPKYRSPERCEVKFGGEISFFQVDR